MTVSHFARTNRLVSAVGLSFLIEDLGLKLPRPAVRSEVVSGARKTRIEGGKVLEQYRPSYLPTDIRGHLRFAMRYEPIDLSALRAIFHALRRNVIEEWVRDEPISGLARRCWFLYELLTGDVLDLPDVKRGDYIDALDPGRHVTAQRNPVPRQRVNDNLLANAKYGVLIRRTEALKTEMTKALQNDARAIVRDCDPPILARAVHYLFTKETKSSFAIEGETPSRDRTERFVAALSRAGQFDLTNKQAFVKLQNSIVDPRYAQKDWRTDQDYVGTTLPDFSQRIHYVCPKPEDVPALMEGWMQMAGRISGPGVTDAACAAAAVAFGFVYIHPFDDGNGRMHRFLVHHVLAKAGFTPPGLLFPVSAAMLRNRAAYDRVLETISAPLLPLIDYALDAEQRMAVRNDTADLYRYFDATEHAEYLYCCIEDTIRRDLEEEIGFLKRFDAAMTATKEVVDMPDRRASLLVKLVFQNKFHLSHSKRGHFAELTDDEIAGIEEAVRVHMAD